MKAEIESIIINFLEGNITPAEKEELSLWLKESEENQKLFLSYYDSWSLSQQTNFNSEEALKNTKILLKQRNLEIKSNPTVRPNKRIYLYVAGFAASLIIAVGTWYIVNSYQSSLNDIRQFAINTQENIKKQTDIQLILSEKQKIDLDNKKPTISYSNKKSIQIDEDKIIDKNNVASYNQLIVPYGKKSMLALEDGTKIWVNAGSRLIYPVRFDDKQREIFIDGEIYLEVAHDKNKPFIVKTKDINIRVLGTKFNVSAYEQEHQTAVILASGSVNVTPCDKSEIFCGKELTPNQMYFLSANHSESVKTVNVSQYISWVYGIYICENETIAQLIRQLEKFYGKKVTCQPEVSSLRCSGKLDLERDLDSLLNGLTETLPIQYQVREDGTYYLTKEEN